MRSALWVPQNPLLNRLNAVALFDPSRWRSCAACVVRRLAMVVYVPRHFATAAGATSDASREIINSRGEVHFRVDEILLPALCVNVFDPQQQQLGGRGQSPVPNKCADDKCLKVHGGR